MSVAFPGNNSDGDDDDDNDYKDDDLTHWSHTYQTPRKIPCWKNPHIPAQSCLYKVGFMFPAFTGGTEGRRLKRLNPSEHPPLRPYMEAQKHHFCPPHAPSPVLLTGNGCAERAKPCCGDAGWGLGQRDTQVDGLGSPQTLQACPTRVFRHHTNCSFLCVSCWENPPFRTICLSTPKLLWFSSSSSPIVRHYPHDGEPCF